MYKIPFSAGAPPRTLLGELTMLPRTPSRMARGYLSPRFLPFGVLILRRTEWGIGPRDNVFPGPAVALDGPVWT